MLVITDGVVRDSRVKYVPVANITHGPLTIIDAIVLHQTDSKSAAGTLAYYPIDKKQTGAHFLIGKDGDTYQCVPLTKQCWHVAPIVSRCYQIHKCEKKEEAKYDSYAKRGFSYSKHQTDKDEWLKPYPQRYPGNRDSIGIELVGMHIDENTYEPITAKQQAVLDWFLRELLETLKLSRTDIYRHPPLSFKNPGEAASAKF